MSANTSRKTSSSEAHDPAPTRPGVVLAALFFGLFVLGCAELLVVGMLDLIATSLHVSVPTAGTLVTACALGLAIGGPLLTALTIRLNRRSVLIASMVIFAVASLVPVLFPSYGLFVVARVISGAVAGLFTGAAFVAGTSIVPPERAGRAISAIISGVAVSAALGVPLGTLAGQAFGWRASFAGIAVLSVVVTMAVAVLVPSVPGSSGGAGAQARYAFSPRVLAVLGLHVLIFGSLYAALTYIVPFLQNVTGISGAAISVFLLAYGAATAVGSFGGGRFADRNPARSLIVGTIGMAAALLALYLTGSIPVLVALVMVAWGVFAFGMTPSLQLRTIALAGSGGGQLAASLPPSAVNLGIALGPLAGGAAFGAFGVSAPVITGLIIAVLGIAAAWATSYLKPPAVTPSSDSEAPVDETTEPAVA
jgi:DHA1 family inner membrane transport protein